uniref:ATP synthase complex subunit 8 n=1 Tax=Platorchestia sp. AKP-2018 TaxID=2306295 RepID=A0A385UKR4_9CRUS|nr:ATP synthase F0 subunit 8 [Platorchestia sp. AKP-2018]
MPQMAPIMWYHLFIIFNMMTLVLTTKIFFSVVPDSTLVNTTTIITNKKTWKL